MVLSTVFRKNAFPRQSEPMMNKPIVSALMISCGGR